MYVLIAPNAFKNSLSAAPAARAIQSGLQASNLSCTCECFPIGDGGDGTGELLNERLRGNLFSARVHDPLGKEITADFGVSPDGTAIIEMASASGLRLLRKADLNPLRASSMGTGELIKAALDKGAREIILTIGGSATTDGGAGILHALGARFLDVYGQSLHPFPLSLSELHDIDLSRLDTRIKEANIIVLCDVDIPLLGSKGAATIFSPQKGAGSEDVHFLEECLSRLREIVLRRTGKDMNSVPSGGAAGGVAAGLWATIDGQLVQGADYYLDATGFDESLKLADLLITGEGSLDAQSLWGKAPVAAAKRAKARGVPVVGMAGQIQETARRELSCWFDRLIAINAEAMNIVEAMAATETNLRHAAKELGDQLAGGFGH